MKFKLTSIKKKVLELDNIDSAIIPTKAGEITILDTHEPLISALKPGILRIKIGSKEELYAIGGGVLETDGVSLNIIADMVEDGKGLDIEDIKAKKAEAKNLLEKYMEENRTMDMAYYIELETQFLKESAKEQLALR
ncbi:MAG: ATP synthase F1 subunit epsilon [Candidatus Gracilibacteria bacterium]|nr:ATP synthase F1 subunit epsilon [Candidatus Gracilibacteria bacterium]MDD2908181.1 ATP synthase F1 subunit epsilon [Candidatus Gracilibacteria bacterium]